MATVSNVMRGILFILFVSFFGLMTFSNHQEDVSSPHPKSKYTRRLTSGTTYNRSDIMTNGNHGHINANSEVFDEEIKRGMGLTANVDTGRQETAREVPPFLGLPNSTFRSPYHKYWETNCSLIFKQDKGAIHATTELLKQSRDDHGHLPVPSDAQFTLYTQNCSEFRKIRGYPEEPYSEEEQDYPLAYIITIHIEIAQVERLLRAIYQPQNIYCVHPDAKSPPEFQKAVKSLVSCFDNVFISSKTEEVQYAGFTRLRSDINCMEDLLKRTVEWRYVMNLCGQDFPLKTNLEIVRQLKANQDHNYIDCFVPPHSKQLRTLYRHVTNDKGIILRTSNKKSPPPFNFTVYSGNAYFAGTRAFVDYVVHDPRATALLKWSEDTYSPDEHYWATLQAYPGVPGGYRNAHELGISFRFIIWGTQKRRPHCIGKYVRSVCVFGMGYLKHLLAQPRLFANKFYYDYDPVTMQCLEEMLDYRQHNPETIRKFVPEYPVTKLVWKDDPSLY